MQYGNWNLRFCVRICRLVGENKETYYYVNFGLTYCSDNQKTSSIPKIE